MSGNHHVQYAFGAYSEYGKKIYLISKKKKKIIVIN